MRICDTIGCDRPSVGIHRIVGPTDKTHAEFGTTTGWEEACVEHIGTVHSRGEDRRATHVHHYDDKA